MELERDVGDTELEVMLDQEVIEGTGLELTQQQGDEIAVEEDYPMAEVNHRGPTS
ncbi:hypothetical protein PM082_010044 [Marasmius tenuissimus]|nr:hypothetical protein PM082_010044 [Marasmius tenuissimus]